MDAAAGQSAQNAATSPTTARGAAAVGALPLSFVPNAGQLDGRVRYTAEAGAAGFFFTKREAVFAFARGKHKGVALRLHFAGANPGVVVAGRKLQAGRVNYLRGSNPAKWRTNVATYGEVVYRDLWPGIDLVFRGSQGRLKYEFHIAPGASVDRIRLAYAGASALSLGRRGNLRVRTSLGTISDSRPVSYQELDGGRVPVASRFLLGRTAGSYGFALGGYDRSRPLVIDPGLSYSTHLGGSGIGYDYGYAIAVDGAGSAYVAGETASTDFPTSAGAYDKTFNGGIDAFVTKLNAAGTALVYSTYLGGALADFGRGIAVDGMGAAYVSGYTYSTNFPTSPGALSENFNGGSNDAFVAKLSADGSALAYSSYLGGSANDAFAPFGNAIAIDDAGSAYVTGQTLSTDFPATALDTSHNGGYDVFVTKMNAAGSALVYSTYLGGGTGDYGYGIAVDGAGSAYVTGETASTNFPATLGAYDTSYNGNPVDSFVTKLNPAGSALAYSTYLGGGFEDHGSAITVDNAGNAYTTGYTASSDFPTTALDTSHGGAQDAFVTKLNASGAALGYSTYLGGSDVDYGYAIALDGEGSARVTGTTASDDFPVSLTAYDTSFNGGIRDAFITTVNGAGSTLPDSTYLGGMFGDFGYGIAVDGAGATYVTGQTSSTNFPTTLGAFDVNFNGGPSDAFVAKFGQVTLTEPLSVQKGGTGQGTVTSDAPGIDCGVDCFESYDHGTVVTLTAHSNVGSEFAGWSGACANASGDCVVTMDAAKSVTATFTLSAVDATTLLPYGTAGYRYKQIGHLEPFAGFEIEAFDDSLWQVGPAAFGNATGCGLTRETQWDSSTDILVRHKFTVPVGMSDVKVHVKVDNDVTVYVNGHNLTGEAPVQNDGCADHQNVPDIGVDTAFLHPGGGNLLAVRAFDRGEVTYLDLQITGVPSAGDVTPPTSSATGPGCGDDTVHVTVVDEAGGSGPKAVHYKVDGGAEQTATTAPDGTATIALPEGSHEIEYWGEDQVGNRELALPAHKLTVLVDRIGPAVTIVSDQGKSTYAAGEPASISVTASDSGRGLDPAHNPTVNGEAISTAAPGAHVITKTAKDLCGNATTKEFPYTVVARRTLTVERIGPGTVNGSGIACGLDCTETYDEGTLVTLGATADPGSEFIGWSDACTNTTGGCTVTMSAAKHVTATFRKTRLLLRVTKAGPGTGKVTSPGIDCGDGTSQDCDETYDSNTVVTLTATPSGGSTFAGWSGACTNASGPCVVTVTEAKTVTATFNAPAAPPPPSLPSFIWIFSTPNVLEGNVRTTKAVFVFSLRRRTTAAISVRYATKNGTAHAPSDYVASSGVVRFPAGGIVGKTYERKVVILVKGDRTPEPNESFELILSHPVNTKLGNTKARAVIRNDDGPVAKKR